MAQKFKLKRKLNILFFLPHTDDFDNGFGGTAILLARAGHKITLVITTLPTDRIAANIRMAEEQRSIDKIGGKLIFLDQPDGKLEVTEALRERTREIYAEVKPDVVFTLWPVDVHPDHGATALLAMGPALQKGVNIELLFGEVCASGRSTTAFRPQSLGFRPTHYVDTSAVQEEKQVLMNFQESQDPEGMWAGMRNVHKNRGLEFGVLFGAQFGVHFAEGYVRATRTGELPRELRDIFTPTAYDLPRGIGVDFDPRTIGL